MENRKPIKSFALGAILITRDAARQLEPGDYLAGLRRHARRDWGDVCEEDAQLNDLGLQEGEQLLSVYHDRKGTRFWIITEANRSATMILLPGKFLEETSAVDFYRDPHQTV